MDSNEKQQRAAAYIRGVLEARGLPRNQVAAFSGLSNTYIQHLENGQIQNVDRKKLIALAVALSLDLDEIDNMLKVFDRASLNEEDIPDFLEASGAPKITSAMLPLHAWFTYELITLIGETIPGRLIIVNEAPTANVTPEGFRSYFNKGKLNPHPIYFKLIEAVGQKRRRNFIHTLRRYPVEHYICRTCLEAYVRGYADDEEKYWKYKHIESLIHVLDKYDNFTFFLTDICPRFNFTLKIPDQAIGENEKLFFQGKAPHSHLWEKEQELLGFATENQVVIKNFMSAIKYIEKNTLGEFHDRQAMIQYLRGLLI
ncbi:MAG: helix-turn-helix transcriptional regulator [Thermodesulfobacteriota bacterium]